MHFELSYVGPIIDDPGILEQLPTDLRTLLEARNGFIAFRGGLHVRGACQHPRWHSLGYSWRSDDALHRLFPVLLASDIPFAQDALGDQYVLRDGEVHRLTAETGELHALSLGLGGFLDAAERDPEGYLATEPLTHFLEQGETLAPGQLLSVYPPFIALESRDGVSLKAVAAEERIRFLAELARVVAGHPDGSQVRMPATD